MNFYHLPGSGIYGGIKVGYQFAALLNELGVPCVVATPDGSAPTWFRTAAPTISHREMLARVRPEDNILFSYPPDYPELRSLGANLIVHTQGTDDRMDRIFADPVVTILTCWPYAHAYALRLTGRSSLDVGLPISDVFYYDGRAKRLGTVAYMPRRGREIADEVQRRNPSLEFIPIEGLSEGDTAAVMKSCEYYLATSVNEQFGLPAFEAMAAAAVVVSVPVVGGMDYLRHGENSLVVAPEVLADTLSDLARPEQAAKRARMRFAGQTTAMTFLPSRQREHVRMLLDGELSYLRAGMSKARALASA
jgi:glycosyltransferase involved in cell wall biosynthesis